MVGQGNLHLREKKPAVIELDSEYTFETLKLECEISGSPYLKTNSIHIRTESQKSDPVIREIVLEKTEDSPVITVEFSKLPIYQKGVQVSKIHFSCNYDITFKVRVFKEMSPKGSDIKFSFLTF